jgi:hypothetical protein
VEYAAVTEQPLSSTFDIAPMWKMYMEPIEVWRKNYASFLNGTPFRANGIGENSGAGLATSFYDGALLQWQKSGEELFKRFVQYQIELCHFFGGRWEQYLKLTEQLSQCRSLTELGELQSAFLSKFASDYTQEAGKLARPVAELARHAQPLNPPHR